MWGALVCCLLSLWLVFSSSPDWCAKGSPKHHLLVRERRQKRVSQAAERAERKTTLPNPRPRSPSTRPPARPPMGKTRFIQTQASEHHHLHRPRLSHPPPKKKRNGTRSTPASSVFHPIPAGLACSGHGGFLRFFYMPCHAMPCPACLTPPHHLTLVDTLLCPHPAPRQAVAGSPCCWRSSPSRSPLPRPRRCSRPCPRPRSDLPRPLLRRHRALRCRA